VSEPYLGDLVPGQIWRRPKRETVGWSSGRVYLAKADQWGVTASLSFGYERSKVTGHASIRLFPNASAAAEFAEANAFPPAGKIPAVPGGWRFVKRVHFKKSESGFYVSASDGRAALIAIVKSPRTLEYEESPVLLPGSMEARFRVLVESIFERLTWMGHTSLPRSAASARAREDVREWRN